MPLRKTDSIYAALTGRNFVSSDVDFILRRLNYFGKNPNQYVSENLQWLTAWNPQLPKPFDGWFMIFQCWLETGGFTTDYYRNDGNMAGIGIWKDGIPSPWDGKLSAELAAQVYLLELMYHTYSFAEIEAFIASDVGKAFLPALQADADHLAKVRQIRQTSDWPAVNSIDNLNDPVPPNNFIWAADVAYGDKIERIALDVAPALPDSKEGTEMAVNIGNRPLRIAVGTGHANTSGGNQFELAINAKVTNEVVKLCRVSDGFEVRCYTPNDGLGMYNGSLDAAASQVTSWLEAGWAADILHEVHQEGLGNATVRGAFVIYPDSEGLRGRNPGNTDLDVKAQAGAMSGLIAQSYGGVCRYAGCSRGMSEKETGVGAQGARLGVFGAWAEPYFIENSFQFITEGAAYTNPTDLDLMKKLEFPQRQALGILRAYVLLAQRQGNWTYPYRIGASPDVPPALLAPDGLPYPEGFDRGILALAFGVLTDSNGTYRFDPNGVVSKAWYSHFKPTLAFARLLWHFKDTVTGREYFGWANGEVLWKPNQTARFRWA